MKKPTDSEAILYAFAVEASHDRATLERYLRQYPELAEELIDLSSELRLNDAITSEPATDQADPGLEAAWTEFLGCTPEKPAAAGAADFFSRYRGQAFASLATAVKIPRSILVALRDGLVDPPIPKGTIRRIASAASEPFETVLSSLSRPQETPAALAFKSDEKPGPQRRITFRQLVLDTEMTDEQRLLLLKECDEDELP